MSWIKDKGPLGDVVLSSRIRLARNLSDTPFPSIMDKDMMDAVIHRVHRSILGEESPIEDDYQFLMMEDLSSVDQQVLVEKHLASVDLMDKSHRAAILIDEDEKCSIMINEEDHIRLQCIFPGYQLKEALDYLSNIDDIMERELPYAFQQDLGYLTSCPTNVGTGMRASVMMHLPALTMTGHMTAIVQTLPKIGVTVRGLYGEGSEAIGDIYQVSNQVTLGISEDEIIKNLEVATGQIVDKERQARQALRDKGKIYFEDKIWRAYGTLQYAKTMSLKEFMSLLSMVRLGAQMGIISQVEAMRINELLVLGQPGHLRKYGNENSTIDDLDFVRTKVVLNWLEKNIK